MMEENKNEKKTEDVSVPESTEAKADAGARPKKNNGSKKKSPNYSKVLILGDLHIGASSGDPIIMDYQAGIIADICRYISDNKITKVIQLGDWYDNKKIPSTPVIEFSNKVIDSFENCGVTELFHLDGNHDLYDANNSTLSSFHEIHGRRATDKMKVHSISEEIALDHDNKLIYVPYLSNDMKKLFNTMIEESADGRYSEYTMFGHFDIMNFKMRNLMLCESGLDASIFKNFKKVVSGHYHCASMKENICYLGTPYQIDWNDFGIKKMYAVLDITTGDIQFIDVADELFMKVSYQHDDRITDLVSGAVVESKAMEGKILKVYATDTSILSDKFQKFSRMASETCARFEVIDHRTITVSSDSQTGKMAIAGMENEDIIESYFNDLKALPENCIDEGQIKKMTDIKDRFDKIYNECNAEYSKQKLASMKSKIYFEKVAFRNFYSFGNALVDIKLDLNSLILIVGKNGRGKTALIEAVYFGLTGESMRGVNKDELINNINKKGTEVTVWFKSGQRRYRIERGIKPNYLKVFVNDEPMQATGVPELQKKLALIVPDGETIKQSIIISMMNYVPFMRLKTDKRRSIVEDYFDTEIFNIMSKNVGSLRSSNTTKISAIDSDIFNSKNSIQIENKNLLDWEAYRKDQLSTIDVNIEDIQNKINANKILIEEQKKMKVNLGEASLTAEIQRLNQINLSLVQQKTKIAMKQQDTVNRQLFFKSNTACPTCSLALDENFRKAQIHQLSEKYNKIQAISAQNTANLNELLADIATVNTKLAEVNRINIEISRLESLGASYEQQLSGLNFNKKDQASKMENREKEIRNSIEALNKRIEKSEQDKKSLVYEGMILEYLAFILDDKKGTGIKNTIVDRWIEYIEVEVNKYLDMMSSGHFAKIDSKFDVVFQPSGKKYEALSAGEKQRFDLAMLFIFNNIAMLKNSSLSANLIFFDEVLDSSLDTDAIGGLMTIFNSFIANGKTCFVVSHRDEVKTLFNKVISVQKDEFSTIERSGF